MNIHKLLAVSNSLDEEGARSGIKQCDSGSMVRTMLHYSQEIGGNFDILRTLKALQTVEEYKVSTPPLVK